MMKEKPCFRNTDESEARIEELICSGQDGARRSGGNAKGKRPVGSKLPSKYRTVVCCSFVNGTRASVSSEKAAAHEG
jgi:hypothetical protein